jgi:hypothetical protein
LKPNNKGKAKIHKPNYVVEGEPHLGTETKDDPLSYSSFWTELRPPNPFTLIKNLFASIINLNRPQTQQIPSNTMAQPQPTNSSKELNLNRPDTFDGD